MRLRDYGKNKDKSGADKKLYFQLHQLEDWSLVTPEILLPSQTKCEKKLSPEQKLLEATLWDCLIDLRFTFRFSLAYMNKTHQSVRNAKVQTRLENLDWVYSNVDATFGCNKICEALDINLSHFRQFVDVCCFKWARNGGEDPKIDYRCVREYAQSTIRSIWHGEETTTTSQYKRKAA